MYAARPVGAEDNGLFDIAGPRRAGNEIDGTRDFAPLGSRAKASSIVATMRVVSTNAMCVSGSRLTVAGESGPESSISVPVSATAQKQAVTPTRSTSSVRHGRHRARRCRPLQAGNIRRHDNFRG